ncbi:unnamed protein product [Meganyctiphanes norvegica]|uniref:C-CAP/cofactor C-like domain-containing protein n=1 Tax=Meganyctiphanes norvegica TaxID=48144 RepID=A0AAV2QHV3_MEGNR
MDSEEAETARVNLVERLKQRNEDLTQKQEQRRIDRQSIKQSKTAAETSDYFHDTFHGMKEEVENKVKGADEVDKGAEARQYLDDLVNDVQKMQLFLNESSMFLASFQVKKAQEHINEINNIVQDKIEKIQPKKKFGFGRKKGEKPNKENKKITDSVDSVIEEKKNVLDDILTEQQFFGFKDKKGEKLVMKADEMENRQLNIQDLQDCTVIALGNAEALQVASLQNCTVVIGPTFRSAFVKDCNNCKFVIACQQLRIHNTVDTHFYLHVTGAGIIENCQRVGFAPYNLKYPELEDHYTKSALDRSTNYWDAIDDFHWLNENEKSPNWYIINEDERISDWT